MPVGASEDVTSRGEELLFGGYPALVWILLAVEFVERLGYYAVAFSLFTYCTNMLRTGVSTANAVVNALYVVIPVAAFASSGLADGRIGRPKTLLVSLVAYAVGLVLLTISSLPLMYMDYPNHPTWPSYLLFAVALAGIGAGYGGMKVCTNPMMADSVVEAHQHIDESGVRVEDAVARLFGTTYWVTNCGALVGIFVAPFLRGLDDRTVTVGDSQFTSGYYYSYSLSSVSVLVGLGLFTAAYHRFTRNDPAPAYVLVRVCYRAAKNRFKCMIGQRADNSALYSDWLSYAAYPSSPSSSEDAEVGGGAGRYNKAYDVVVARDGSGSSSAPTSPLPQHHTYGCTSTGGDPDSASVTECRQCQYDMDDSSSAGWIADTRATLAVCRAFVALPIYWLICNQYSTNLMVQATALRLTPGVPQEVFNNINTFTVLVFLALYDRILEHFRARSHPAVARVVMGFGLMLISMLWCGTVQWCVAGRGSYDDSDAYVLNDGAERLSAMWLVVPYVLQGVASALVDPAIMEIAYLRAPQRMKGQVMGLYWVASSASGFLGIALSPILTPQNATILFFSFALSLVPVTVLFYLLNRTQDDTDPVVVAINATAQCEPCNPDKLKRENDST